MIYILIFLSILILFIVIQIIRVKNESYIIEDKQLNSLEYQENTQQQQIVNIVFKEAYWESFFDYTFSHIGKKGTIVLCGIKFHPNIVEPIYDYAQLSGEFKDNIQQKVEAMKLKKDNNSFNSESKVNFLEKMLLKYDFAPSIAYKLIKEYHSLNTTEASKKCLALYEKMNQKNITIKSVYNEIFDCYTDLGKTQEALEFLALVKPLIAEEEQYIFYEKRAYVYTLESKIQKAKNDYSKAIEIFKNSDLLKGMNLSDKNKQEVTKIKEKELLKLKELLFNLDKINNFS